MAHIIKELKFGSREGSSRGAGGVNDSRTFLVTLDISDDDFAEDRYPDPRGIVELYKVRYGDSSPWNAYAKATQYEVAERLGNKTWKVRVLYTIGGVAATTMEASWDRWTVSIRGAATTQQIREEPNEAIESWGINTGPNARPGKLIGTPRFDKGEPAEPPLPEGRTYSANLWRTRPDGKIESYSQPLTLTDSRTVRPYTEDVQALTYSQTRLFANFDLALVGFIAPYYKRVNLFKYLGAQPAHLKFVDFTLDEIPHLIGDGSMQLEPGIAYRASLVFLWSAKPFTPLRLVATVRDELGNEVPAIDNEGHKVVDENWTIEGVNFDTLVRVVGYGVNTPPGIRPR